METFSALLAISAGNSPVTGEFPAQRPVTRGFDVFFDLRLNKRLCKQLWGWWFETPTRSLWHNCNVSPKYSVEYRQSSADMGCVFCAFKFWSIFHIDDSSIPCYGWPNLYQNLFKIFKIVLRVTCGLLWKFHENTFMPFRTMLLTDKLTNQPKRMKT